MKSGCRMNRRRRCRAALEMDQAASLLGLLANAGLDGDGCFPAVAATGGCVPTLGWPGLPSLLGTYVPTVRCALAGKSPGIGVVRRRAARFISF